MGALEGDSKMEPPIIVTSSIAVTGGWPGAARCHRASWRESSCFLFERLLPSISAYFYRYEEQVVRE